MLLGADQVEDCQWNAEKMYNKAKEYKDNNIGKGNW
jgi:hypothetical protein